MEAGADPDECAIIFRFATQTLFEGTTGYSRVPECLSGVCMGIVIPFHLRLERVLSEWTDDV